MVQYLAPLRYMKHSMFLYGNVEHEHLNSRVPALDIVTPLKGCNGDLRPFFVHQSRFVGKLVRCHDAQVSGWPIDVLAT
jgi:hypothetical protein